MELRVILRVFANSVKVSSSLAETIDIKSFIFGLENHQRSTFLVYIEKNKTTYFGNKPLISSMTTVPIGAFIAKESLILDLSGA